MGSKTPFQLLRPLYYSCVNSVGIGRLLTSAFPITMFVVAGRASSTIMPTSQSPAPEGDCGVAQAQRGHCGWWKAMHLHCLDIGCGAGGDLHSREFAKRAQPSDIQDPSTDCG